MNDYDYMAKIVLVGESGVGKSSIMLKYVDDQFSETFINTIGVDFKIKNIKVNDKNVKLQIWDTAGQERFRTITSSYYRGANAAIIFFDLTDLSSFACVPRWIEEVNRYTTGTVLYVVGNKCDMVSKIVIASEMINDLCDKYHIEYMQASAKTGENIDEIFDNVVIKIIANKMLHQNINPININARYPSSKYVNNNKTDKCGGKCQI